MLKIQGFLRFNVKIQRIQDSRFKIQAKIQDSRFKI